MGGKEQLHKVTYPGVLVRGNCIRIQFVWPKGSRSQRKVTLKGIEVNNKNLKYAYGLVTTIKKEIDLGVFEWSKHFPEHRLAQTELKAQIGYTVQQLLDDYLEDYAKDYRESITVDNYAYRAKQILQPHFGHLPVNHLTAAHIVDWAIAMGKKNITTVTLKSYIAPLRAAFKWARSKGSLNTNPFTDFEWPEETKAVKRKKAQKRKQKRLDVFNKEEVETLVSKCMREQESNLFQFGFWSGLRPEELFALHWEDIDFVSGTAFISRAKIYRRGYKVIDYKVDTTEELKGVKTGELGEREIILLPKALEALKLQKQWTMMERKFVFHNPYWDKPWTNTNQLANRFKECCLQSGVRYRRPYMMRHTYASMMLKHGEDESFVARQLGHVDTTMVRKTYREFIPDSGSANGYKFRNDWDSFSESRVLAHE